MSALVDRFPCPAGIRCLLMEDFAGRDVAIGAGQPLPLNTTNVVGVYGKAKLAMAAVVIVDLEGAARSAAHARCCRSPAPRRPSGDAG